MALLAPKICYECHRPFEDGDEIIFERRGKITLNDRKRSHYWRLPPNERYEKTLEVFQTSDRIRSARHIRCPQ